MARPAFRRLSVALAGGGVGGLANGLAIWLAGETGLTALLGVRLAPELTPMFLYSRIVWGALWGLLFFLPTGRLAPPARGFLLSLAPTLVQLLVVYPLRTPAGPFGGLGSLTPAVVVAANAVWGIAASWWVSRSVW